MNLTQHVNKAQETVLEAGKLIKSMRDTGNLETTLKPDRSPVTNADKKAEKYVRQALLTAFPKDGFQGEETPEKQTNNNYTWICDPIDGTRSFIGGRDTYSVSLALTEGEKTVMGIVNNPERRELYVSAEGQPTTLNGKTLPQKESKPLNKATVHYQIASKRKKDTETLQQLTNQAVIGTLKRQNGSVAYQLAQVTKEPSNAYVFARPEYTLNNWDIAAGIHLIRSIGGKVTGLDGKDIEESEQQNTMLAATTPELHQELLETLVQAQFGKQWLKIA